MLKILKQIDASVPRGLAVHVILDNLWQTWMTARLWPATRWSDTGHLSTVAAYLQRPQPVRRQALDPILDVLPARVEMVGDLRLHLARMRDPPIAAHVMAGLGMTSMNAGSGTRVRWNRPTLWLHREEVALLAGLLYWEPTHSDSYVRIEARDPLVGACDSVTSWDPVNVGRRSLTR